MATLSELRFAFPRFAAYLLRFLVVAAGRAVLLLVAASIALAWAGASGAEPQESLPRISANANRVPAGELGDGVLTIRLEVREGKWYPEAEEGPWLVVQAFAEEGRAPEIPGPLIRVPQGTEVRASVRNLLANATAVVRGLAERPSDGKQTLAVPPGETREVRFRAGAPGTYYYWATTTGKTMEERFGVVVAQ